MEDNLKPDLADPVFREKFRMNLCRLAHQLLPDYEAEYKRLRADVTFGAFAFSANFAAFLLLPSGTSTGWIWFNIVVLLIVYALFILTCKGMQRDNRKETLDELRIMAAKYRDQDAQDLV